MVYSDIITGKYISLRAVSEYDAEFILKLRNDENKNKYVHSVDNDINKEILWIKEQRERKGDYFFAIIRNEDSKTVGTISIYNVDSIEKTAELGRWISYGASIENIESIMLAHEFAFGILNIENVYTKTLQDNKNVVSLWRRFGGKAESNKEIDGVEFYVNTIEKDDYLNRIKCKYTRFFKGK